MKRVLAVLSALCLLITCFPAAVAAETDGDLTYSVANGKVTITDCAEAATGELTIPATIAGYPVTTIGISAFENCAGLTAVIVGENVTTIGDYAFSNCTQLASVTVGAKVTSIGSAVFSGCTGLSSLSVADGNPVYHDAGNALIETSSKTLIAGCKTSVIPTDGSVTAIGSLAFYKCEGLTAITIPDNILSIGRSAFEGCVRLADVTIGSGVAAIGDSAFLGCTALTGVIIPDSVTTMGVYVFSGCTNLTSVDIGEQVAAIGNSAFAGCTELADLTIGASVTAIDVFAFSGCSKLTDVVIPNGVATIGKFAFYNCEALTDVEIPESVSSIGSNAFSGCGELELTIDEDNTYAVTYAQNNSVAYNTFGIGSIAVTTVVLRPSEAGVYFGGNLDWAASDEDVLSYGFAASIANPEPVADGSDESSRYTQGSTSALITEFLDTESGKEVNESNAKTKIYARAYVQLKTGEYVYSDAVTVTLKQVVIAAQNKWGKLTEKQQEDLMAMYTKYIDVMSAWDVPNLKNNYN